MRVQARVWIAVFLLGMCTAGSVGPVFGVVCPQVNLNQSCPLQKMYFADPECCIVDLVTGPNASVRISSPHPLSSLTLIRAGWHDHISIIDHSLLWLASGLPPSVQSSSQNLLKTTILLL